MTSLLEINVLTVFTGSFYYMFMWTWKRWRI